jgi:hypothetical protein
MTWILLAANLAVLTAIAVACRRAALMEAPTFHSVAAGAGQVCTRGVSSRRPEVEGPAHVGDQVCRAGVGVAAAG